MISKFIKNQLKNALVLGALLTCGNMLAQLGLTWTEMGPNDIGGRTRSLLIDKMDATAKQSMLEVFPEVYLSQQIAVQAGLLLMIKLLL